MKEIADCHVFVYMMSPHSLSSPYCLAEYEEARRLHKHILPVKLRKGTRVPERLSELHYVDLTGAITAGTLAPLRRSLNERLDRPASTRPPLTDTPVAQPVVPLREPRNWIAQPEVQALIALIGLIVAILGVVQPLLPSGLLPTIEGVISTLAAAPTLSAFEELQTAQMRSTNAAAARVAPTETAARATLLALSWTPTPTYFVGTDRAYEHGDQRRLQPGRAHHRHRLR